MKTFAPKGSLLLAVVLGATLAAAPSPAAARALEFVESEPDTPPLSPTALALSPDGRHVYVTSFGMRLFTTISLPDRTVGALNVFARDPD